MSNDFHEVELNKMRENLYKLINPENLHSEQVLELSVEIDGLILDFYTEKNTIEEYKAPQEKMNLKQSQIHLVN